MNLDDRPHDSHLQPVVLVGCIVGVAAGFLSTAISVGLAALLCAFLIADRQHCWTPGRIVLLWQYTNYIIAPAIDGGWGTPTWVSALVSAVAFLSHAAHIALAPERKLIASHLDSLRRVELRTCLGLGLVGGGSMLYLMSIGAFEQLAGKITVDAPFKAVAGSLKTLIYPALAILGLRWQSSWKAASLAMILLAVAAGGTLLSGRKEEFLLSLGIFAAFTYAGSASMGRRAVIILSLCAVAAIGSTLFMYEMRRHYFFFVPGYNASIGEVIIDTIDDRNLVPGYEYSIWSRLNHLEPTERFFDKGLSILGPGDISDLAAYSITPGPLKSTTVEQPNPSFRFGYDLGYASFYGDTAISAGPTVEFVDVLGWAGLVLVVLMPIAIDRMLAIGMSWHRVGLVIFWVLLLRALTYERFLIHFISLLPAMVIPLALGFFIERLLLRRPFLFILGLPPSSVESRIKTAKPIP
jgi:hypothetical protein